MEERNELLENDLKMAKLIQQKFISDKLPNDSVYAVYKPMEAIGGDYYEFIDLDDSDEIGIFISDVSGHGVPAALITAMLKSFIEQAGTRKNNPAELVDYLNNSLVDLTGLNFITAFYGIYNRKTREFTYANAGHNPPFFISNHSVSCLHGKHSFPLAIFKEPQLVKYKKKHVNNTAVLAPDSALILYTDGLTEARNKNLPDLQFESGDLLPLLINIKIEDPKHIIETVYENLVSFRGCDSFDDDVCIICLMT